MPSDRGSLVFLQLNEINFDLVEKYLQTHELPAFRKLVSKFERLETFAEQNYTELEPWIQWVSVHSGKTFSEHRVFRLGDAVNSDVQQVFELLEQKGLRVGAISPMNARNELRSPAFFVPDPWTATRCDDSGFSRRLIAMLRQTVNDNARRRISMSSTLTLAEAVLRTFSLRNTPQLLALIAKSVTRPWHKALVLDHVIHLVHRYLLRRTRPDVSFVFLNAGAHIQHHYYFNSPFVQQDVHNPEWYVGAHDDPILDMLKAYDHMLRDYLDSADEGVGLIVATGLTQLPYDRVKFYYRLVNHLQFLRLLGVQAESVMPRMTRDFDVLFADRSSAERAIKILSSACMERDSVPLFAEIDDRGLSLFVTLTYPNEIQPSDAVLFSGGRVNDFLHHVSFVAIKNGMHSTKGFAYFSPRMAITLPRQPVHVASLFQLTIDAATRAVAR